MRMKIGTHEIGGSAPLFVVAEIGLNHGGSLDLAIELVDAAAEAGASAVKLQSLRGATLVAASCPPPAHVACDSLQAFFETFELDEACHRAVADRARMLGLAFMSTPFDEAAVDMLERVGCEAFKIASGDLTHHGLIARAARTGRPLVISTGMSELDEVAAALACARAAGAREIALLHCVSAYPVPAGAENLSAIASLAREFSVPVGLSDHASDLSGVGLAVALGASIYERHIVSSAESGAIDAAVSSTREGFEEIVRLAARTKRMLGDGRRTCGTAEQPNRMPSRRSLYATRTLTSGHVVSSEDVIALRPAAGLGAEHLTTLIGVRVERTIPAGAPFIQQDLDTATRAAASGALDAA